MADTFLPRMSPADDVLHSAGGNQHNFYLKSPQLSEGAALHHAGCSPVLHLAACEYA